MRTLTVLALLALAACGPDESSETDELAIPSNYLSVGITNDDATRYKVRIYTYESTGPFSGTSSYTDLWNPTESGPSAHSITVVLPPSSATVSHYFTLHLNSDGSYVDMTGAFPFEGGSKVLYLRVSSGAIYWSTSPSGPWMS